jgi:hypothetical protein
MTFLAIGVVLALPPGDRRAGPPVIVAALLLDVVFLAAALAAKWVIPTLRSVPVKRQDLSASSVYHAPGCRLDV